MPQDSTITSVSLGRGPEAIAVSAAEQLVLLAVSDDLTLPSSRHLLDDVDEVRFGRGPREARRTDVDGRCVLSLSVPDGRMSTQHGRLTRGAEAWVLDDPTSKNGAVVDGVLTRRTVVGDGALIELGHTFFLFRIAPVEVDAPDDVIEDELTAASPALTTFDGALAERYAALARVAPTDVSIVLLGETGTGKELVARAVHDLSQRKGAFVAVNCGALPQTLLEAELFGHRKGAFSGAAGDRRGLIRSADQGTLLLDEVGELPAASQVAFLRVMQEREVVPVGDDRPVKVDLRLCAATLRDLDAMVAAGTFRRDLYARLFGVTIELPPLRQRRSDLGLILRALLRRSPGSERVTMAPAAMRAIFRHDWPLNIRELEKALSSARALAGGAPIELAHLPAAVTAPPRIEPPQPVVAAPTALDSEEEALRHRLIALLVEHDGNVVAVAEALGKRRMQVYRWARRFAIKLGDYRR